MALEFYVTIEGTKQGKFKGESTAADHKDQLAGLAFDYEVISPRDPATGPVIGKLLRKPITFTKEWGAASPQLYQALITNEELKSVEFEFMHTDANGQQIVYHTIRLVGAAISRIRQRRLLVGPNELVGPDELIGPNFRPELEEVSLVFKRIIIENKVGGTTVNDDWQVPI